MKIKNILYSLVLIALITIQLNAQANTNPEVTNVAFSITGTTVTATYNVTDAVQTSVTIIMLVSSNNGSTWDYNYGTATGDIGTNVSVGSNKTIQWTYTGDYNPNFKIRIYANDETADGSPCPGVATVEYEGKTHHTIQIGTQCWLKENLDVGTRINVDVLPTNDGIIHKYCYGEVESNCIAYGGLYNWNEAMEYIYTEGSKGICPTGWHIPSLSEFLVLNKAAGNNTYVLRASGGSNPNTSGFTALLSGARHANTYYLYFGEASIMHTSTAYGGQMSYREIIGGWIANDPQFNWGGRSVRCLKD